MREDSSADQVVTKTTSSAKPYPPDVDHLSMLSMLNISRLLLYLILYLIQGYQEQPPYRQG